MSVISNLQYIKYNMNQKNGVANNTGITKATCHYFMPLKQDDLEKARRVKAIIEKEYFKSHSVEDLASIVGTNKCTLNCLFHEITYMPVKQYLLWFRIEKAKDFLTSTNDSIKQIAGKVGISRRNLERQFKKLVRMTPYEWRKKEQDEWKRAGQDAM